MREILAPLLLAATISGYWSGTVTTPAGSLPIGISISADTAVVDALPLGLIDKPVKVVSRTDDHLQLEMSTGYSQPNMDRLIAGNVDFAFIGVSIGERRGITIRTLDRHEIVVVMTPENPLAQMDRVPIERLRGEPIITVSQGVNGPMAAASLSWLERHTGEPPNVARQEPPDQMAAALARSGNAIALMTAHRAAQA